MRPLLSLPTAPSNTNVHHTHGLSLGEVSSHPDALRAWFNLPTSPDNTDNTQTHSHETNHQVSL